MLVSKDFNISALNADERLELISVLWDSLLPEEIPVPQSHSDELERRQKAYEAGEIKSYSWEEVKQRLKLGE